MDLNPYLNLAGSLEEAFTFYAEVLGGEITVLQRFAEMPGAEDLSEAQRHRVMHGEIRFGNRKLMGSDTLDSPSGTTIAGVHLQIGWTDFDQAQRTFDALAAGGEIDTPFAETFWSPGFGMCRDRFGVAWMINVYGPDYLGDPDTAPQS